MLAAAAVASVQHARRRETERALRDLMRGASPSFYLGDWESELRRPVTIILVYVHSVSLVSKFADKRMQLRLRYGSAVRFMEKYSPKVRCAEAADGSIQAQFEAMFVLAWNDDLEPIIALDLIKLGWMDWTISTAAMRMPFREGRPGSVVQDLVFTGKKGEDGLIGNVEVMLEVKAISPLELELGIGSLPLAFLDPLWNPPPERVSTQVFDASLGPVVQGRPVSFSEAAAAQDDEVADGRVVGEPRRSAGGALGSAAGLRAGPHFQESVLRDGRGSSRHVVVTRFSDGREHRMEWRD
eukprot:TRINITY_DN26954_c0_g1_i1.p1 TRINITY_DN26954_c0_g1~~TRINITY_DN26954_c0_g1_i1.p1  ORF type:complete len:314 (+),score=60.44 TRINITY_DN26954_c0_g1_i1:54-944(+)